LTTYHLMNRTGRVILTRQIEEEIARESEAMNAAKRGMAVADAWLSVLDTTDLASGWARAMTDRGYAGDEAIESTYHSAMPTRLVQHARRTWAAAYDGAKDRHTSLMADWKALAVDDGDGPP
jgi:hypothetical protein